jgi:hypothetical protein
MGKSGFRGKRDEPMRAGTTPNTRALIEPKNVRGCRAHLQ